MKGKPRTLLTWFGKSERPVAMIASGRTALASGGQISGSGLAMAKMIGSLAISSTIAGLSAPAADRPRKTSAPTSASSSVRASVSTECADFHWSRSVRPVWMTPLRSHMMTWSPRTPIALINSVQAIAAAPAPFTTTRILSELAAGQVAGVDQARRGDDRGAVLVVVEDGDVHPLAQRLLDHEAVGRGNVLEVDSAEARLEQLDRFDEPLRRLRSRPRCRSSRRRRSA